MPRPPETLNPENQSYGLLDNTPAFIFATVSPLLNVFLEAKSIEAGLLTLIVGETIAAILYIKGKPKNPENNLPKKPLAVGDEPVTIVNFKTVSATN
jgi:hypothetical protein